MDNKALLGNRNEKDFVTNFNLGEKDVVSKAMQVDGNSVVAVHLTSLVYSDFYQKKYILNQMPVYYLLIKL